MPLSEKARIEVYLPDLPNPAYRNLAEALEREFTYTFGGCTINRGLEGSFLSRAGLSVRDPIALIYTDVHQSLEPFQALSNYLDKLRQAVSDALEEEAILVTVHRVFHSVS
ncbi:MAG TPA: hypothetical protein VI756_11940 [Blastocatellia bacterium]